MVSKDIKLTADQVKLLEPYEQFFLTAIRSRYARYPGEVGIKTIHKVYCEVSKTSPRLNTGCSSCIFRLLVDCGDLYFKAKSELEKQKVEQTATAKKKTSKKANKEQI